MKKDTLKADFWLKLGLSYEKHGNYKEAIDSYVHGITLAPERSDGYLYCAKAYMDMEDFEQAFLSCDAGLCYAKEHAFEPWAKKLTKELEACKAKVSQEYAKSEYGTFSS